MTGPSPAARPSGAPKLLFLVTEDWAFWRHRLPMALAAKAAGYDVAVACRVRDHGPRIEALGIRIISLPWDRRGVNPLAEARLLLRVQAVLRREMPDLVHSVALKPAVHGALAADLTGRPPVVTTVAGLGWVYISDSLKARLVRPVITWLFRWLLNRPDRRLMVQNPDDRAFFADRGVVRADRIALVPGSGVDMDLLPPAPEPDGPPLFCYVGRMLADKGLNELAEAARRLRDAGRPVRLALVGEPDPGNPASLDADTLRAWEAEGLCKWWGHRDDIADVWKQAHVAVLPSYREGLPKALLEAACVGRPGIAADAPGSRDVVADGTTGLLVPVRDSAALAEAMAALADDAPRRRAMGMAARARVEAEFSAERIGAQTVDLYRSLLGDRAPGGTG